MSGLHNRSHTTVTTSICTAPLTNAMKSLKYVTLKHGETIKNCLQIQSHSALFSKFSWGACPQTPLEGLCFALRRVCFAHHDSTPPCLMARQFNKWPIKLTFDWPSCPSNIFGLYCTLTHSSCVWQNGTSWDKY